MDYEDKVRKAAAALKSAVADAEANGYVVNFPTRAADLEAIEISATGKASVVVTVQNEDVTPEVAAKAGAAAQRAADRVVDKALAPDPADVTAAKTTTKTT